MDLVYLGAIALLFLLTWGLVGLCARIGEASQ
jgi:hypothetical protein